jgi:thymidylate kinase
MNLDPEKTSVANKCASSSGLLELLSQQLDCRGVGYAIVQSREPDDRQPCIEIHHKNFGDLKKACQSLDDVRVIGALGSSAGAQIVLSEDGGRHYSTIRVKQAAGQNLLATFLCRGSACLHPNGLFLIVLGPDGVGKSTTIQRLQLELQSIFSSCRKQRWRPGLVRKVAPDTGNRMPHAKSIRRPVSSILSLLGLATDFSLGYVFSAYPEMVRSEAIIFDRYFHDLLIDPKRFRYGGPLWLPRLISRFIPPRNAIFIVLDADEELILSRKQELPLHELNRQRLAYKSFASKTPNSMIINTEKPIDEIVAEIMDKVLAIMSSRNRYRTTRPHREDLELVSEATGATHSQH